MAQLTFPIVNDELVVDVRINLAAQDLVVLQAMHQPAPSSVITRAILDTGGNATGVAIPILQSFQLRPAQRSKTRGIGGAQAVDLYRVSISVFDAAQPQLPSIIQPDLLVMELPSSFPVDVLIGMDTLLACRTIVDGPNRILTFNF